jgi:hypothetical protein
MPQKRIDKLKDVKELLDGLYEIVDDELSRGNDPDDLQKTAEQLVSEALELYSNLIGSKQ